MRNLMRNSKIKYIYIYIYIYNKKKYKIKNKNKKIQFNFFFKKNFFETKLTLYEPYFQLFSWFLSFYCFYV